MKKNILFFIFVAVSLSSFESIHAMDSLEQPLLVKNLKTSNSKTTISKTKTGKFNINLEPKSIDEFEKKLDEISAKKSQIYRLDVKIPKKDLTFLKKIRSSLLGFDVHTPNAGIITIKEGEKMIVQNFEKLLPQLLNPLFNLFPSIKELELHDIKHLRHKDLGDKIEKLKKIRIEQCQNFTGTNFVSKLKNVKNISIKLCPKFEGEKELNELKKLSLVYFLGTKNYPTSFVWKSKKRDKKFNNETVLSQYKTACEDID